MRVESPPFTPDAQFHVSLSEGRGEVLDFGLELLLAAVGRAPGTIAAGKSVGAAVEELTLPLSDRRLTHLQAPGDLGLGRLATQDGEHDLQLLLGRVDGFASHERLLSGAGEPMINGSPTNRDTLHWPQPFTYLGYSAEGFGERAVDVGGEAGGDSLTVSNSSGYVCALDPTTGRIISKLFTT
jgi:hypothetical protein